MTLSQCIRYVGSSFITVSVLLSTGVAGAEEVEGPPTPMSETDKAKADIPQVESFSGSKYNQSGAFVGFGLGLGQSKAAHGSGGDLAFDGKIEPGYRMATSSWSRVEASAELFFGSMGYRADGVAYGSKVKMPIGFGFLAKLGYGYSLGSNLFATWKLGVGPVLARYEGDTPDGKSVEATNSLMGLAVAGAFELTIPMAPAFDAVVGAEYTNYTFDLGDVRIDGTRTSAGKSLSISAIQATMGARMNF